MNIWIEHYSKNIFVSSYISLRFVSSPIFHFESNKIFVQIELK
jgi:hypothetical protein